MENKPEYKIHGLERRKLKQELSKLKFFCKDFWHYHHLDLDMCSIYGDSGDFPMSNSDAEILFQTKMNEIKRIEEQLLIKYVEECK